MTSFRKLHLFAAFFSFLLLASAVDAAEDPAQMKQKANADVQTGAQIMQKAFQTIQGNPSAEARQVAVTLFVQAGQLFEEATNLYKALVPQYATVEDVQNAQSAMAQCIQAIQKIRAA